MVGENQSSFREEGGAGFLGRECLVEKVEFITNVRYEESVWMKVGGKRGSMVCVLPRDSACASVIENSYIKLKEDVLGFRRDFNVRVGKSTDDDDVIGMVGEETCNASLPRIIF